MSIRPITQTLALLQGGTFIDQCSELLAATVQGVDETGKSGKLTITLDLKKSAGAISIAAKVTNKTPEVAADADLMWPTVEGNLQLDNPKQAKLNFGVVDVAKREILDTDQQTGEIKFAG
jgi:hypothetical protein